MSQLSVWTTRNEIAFIESMRLKGNRRALEGCYQWAGVRRWSEGVDVAAVEGAFQDAVDWLALNPMSVVRR